MINQLFGATPILGKPPGKSPLSEPSPRSFGPSLHQLQGQEPQALHLAGIEGNAKADQIALHLSPRVHRVRHGVGRPPVAVSQLQSHQAVGAMCVPSREVPIHPNPITVKISALISAIPTEKSHFLTHGGLPI